MIWDQTGATISGEYKGVYYAGKVTDSRVKYGGTVQHTVELFEPITVQGNVRHTILVEDGRYRNQSHA